MCWLFFKKSNLRPMLTMLSLLLETLITRKGFHFDLPLRQKILFAFWAFAACIRPFALFDAFCPSFCQWSLSCKYVFELIAFCRFYAVWGYIHRSYAYFLVTHLNPFPANFQSPVFALIRFSAVGAVLACSPLFAFYRLFRTANCLEILLFSWQKN